MAETVKRPMVNLAGEITHRDIPKRVIDYLHKHNVDTTDAVILRQEENRMLVKCGHRVYEVVNLGGKW